MKVKRREIIILMVPCLAWVFGVARSQPRPALSVTCRAETLVSEPSWKETDTRITTKMGFADGEKPSNTTLRWYYNSRIEGFIKGRKQIFYSSVESDDWKCWFASSNSVAPRNHELRERFALKKIPTNTKNLTYTVEVVAFKSTYVSGEPVERKRIAKMRRWKNFAGYGSHSITLKR